MDINSDNEKLNTKEGDKMIIMNAYIDNFFSFKKFNMNMSYPRKISDSYIEGEYLKERENFRYKKVNILMGSNATGKTSFGQMLMAIFNFVERQEVVRLRDIVADKSKEASFSLDFVARTNNMYRLDVKIMPQSENSTTDVLTLTRIAHISKKDSYEKCVEKIESQDSELKENYIEELKKIEPLGWMFSYPRDNTAGIVKCGSNDVYPKALELTLKALDPSIKSVEKLHEVKDSYIIHMNDHDLLIQDGEVIKENILSSGTKAGIDIAEMISAIIEGEYGFYYCDEKFSYVHSDIERTFLNIMISCLPCNEQLFFTTHNLDILDMPLPKHSFVFLKKDINNNKQPISCIYVSDYLKKNTDSIRNAVENDLFSISPSVDYIYEIANLM